LPLTPAVRDRFGASKSPRSGEGTDFSKLNKTNSKGQFSDIDLAILVDSPPDDPLFFEINLETELETIVKYQVDVRILKTSPIILPGSNPFRNGVSGSKTKPSGGPSRESPEAVF